jgi:DNA-binding transcriptional LysR family regulator
MIDLNDIYYFAKVVEYGGITAAARSLKIPKSRVSRRVQALEKSLGAELIQCTSRRFAVTTFGIQLHRYALAMLVQAQALETFARSQDRDQKIIMDPTVKG